jgi:3-oxoadipate enol-lactonase
MSAAMSTLPPGGWVDIGGRGRTWVWDSGPDRHDRPPIVLLHGWTSTAALNWHACFAPLAALTRVVALDHRGHGRGIEQGPYTLESFADDAAGLIDVLGLRHAVVAGYSMGGPVAQLLWRRHPRRVLGLVLCATSQSFCSSSLPSPVVRSLTAGTVAAVRAVPRPIRVEALRRWVAARYPETAAWARAEREGGHDPLALIQAAASLATFDSSAWIGEIDKPTTVVVTTEDRVIPPERQRALAAAIPHARLIEVRGDHRVCVGAPRRFVPALRAGYRHAIAHQPADLVR